MKKIFIAISFLIANIIYGQSGETITLKIEYRPNTSYRNTLEQKNITEIKYIGNAEFLQTMRESGVENPTVTNTSSTTESVYRTYKSPDGINFPLTIEFERTINSDGKKIIPDGTIIYGHGSITSLPQLDSIVSKEMDQEVKSAMLEMMQSTFSQLSFPDKKLRIGESVSIDTPLKLPIAGSTINMTINTIYKLISIKDDMADIDIVQKYTIDSDMAMAEMTATGSGKGRMIYDIKNAFNKKYQVATTMKMVMQLEEFGLELNTSSEFVQNAVITRN